jgi:hypothetical protein
MESDLYIKIQEYLTAKVNLSHALTQIDIIFVDDNLKQMLIELVKDFNFEAKIFELLLKTDKELAINHLKAYYLDGKLKNNLRYKGNIDVMFDDMNNILGNDVFHELIDNLPRSTKSFYPVKNAIDFVEE